MSSNAHKPSEKHTLDEVLKSLQDLMRGELLQEAPKPPPPPKPHYGKVGRPRKPPKPPTEPATTPAQVSDPVDVNAVLASLRSLVSHELAPENGNAPAAARAEASKSATPTVESTEPSFTSAAASIEVEQALAEADEALADLSEVSPAVTSEPVTELAASPSPTETTTASPDDTRAPDLEPTTAAALETVAEEAPITEPPVPPEGAQQEFSFGEFPATGPIVIEELSLEHSPSEAVSPQTDASPESAPDTIGEAQIQVDELPTTATADGDEAVPFDAELAVPADEEPANTQDASETSFEEVVLEAAPPPADESPETITLSADTKDLAAPPSITLSAASSSEPETLTVSDLPTNAVDLEVEDPASSGASPAELSASDIDGGPAAAETSPGFGETGSIEIEVAEAPGSPLEIEGAEPPAGSPLPGGPDLGTLGGHMEVDLGDLPILQDVVVPPPAAAQMNLIEPPLPAADRARELAVRVAARLNIERRKRGEAGIDTKTIHRLQQLLREELEKAGAKGENTPKP